MTTNGSRPWSRRAPPGSIRLRPTGWRLTSTSRGTTVTALGTPWLPYITGPVGTCGG